MANSGPFESQRLVESNRTVIGFADLQENTATVARAEFVNQRSGHALTLMPGMCCQAEDFEFVGEGPPPHEVSHHFPTPEFRDFEGIVAERPVQLTESRPLNVFGLRMVRGAAIANRGFGDDGTFFSIHNQVL